MRQFLSVCVILCVSWEFSTAAALQGRASSYVAVSHLPQQRTLRATGSNGQTNNMTVAFVPLISIIANLLPRFFNRYASMSPATVQQARSYSSKANFECQTADHVGMKWSDHFNSSHYYECYVSKYCSRNEKTSCVLVRQRKCQTHEQFDFHMQQCKSTYPLHEHQT